MDTKKHEYIPSSKTWYGIYYEFEFLPGSKYRSLENIAESYEAAKQRIEDMIVEQKFMFYTHDNLIIEEVIVKPKNT